MEPLSITASIVAVLQATSAVISVCYDYSAAINNSSWELPRVTEEIKSLRDVLENLELIAKRAESTDPAGGTRLPTLKLLCDSNTRPGILTNCLKELERLQQKLRPPSWSGKDGSKRRALIQAVSWPLREADTRKTLENIGKFKATLSLALNADQATLMLEIKDTAQTIQDTTQSLQKDFTSMRIDNEREKMHQWLSAPDPSLNHNKACEQRQATTGSWFIRSQQFTNWKANPDVLLWLHGIPGCGKTILSSTIIEDVFHQRHSNSAIAVVYFYFDFNDAEKQNHDNMLRSLITQLSIQSSSTPQALKILFSSCVNGKRQPVIEALVTTFQQMVEDFDETFIIFDALDECKERQKLMELIEKIVAWKLGTLHILATSREVQDIKESLEPLVHDQDKICIQSALVTDDIRAYVHERLQTDRRLRRWQKQPKVQDEIENALINRADGIVRFRWAVCQLDALEKCLTLPMLRKALASLPKTLDETYTRILCNIDDEYRQYAFTILQWLAYSARPLRIEEVAEVITVDMESDTRFDIERRLLDPQEILTFCSSLVTTVVVTTGSFGVGEDSESEAGRVEVRLAHFSVKEYLVSERIQIGRASHYSIRELDANMSIAEICLAYLLQFDKPDSLTSQTLEEFPLAKYAAEYWTQHARITREDTDQVNVLIMELFLAKRDAYMNWLRLFYPDPPELNEGKSYGTPLYYASLSSLVRPVSLLLKAGADVHAQGKYGDTALMAASLKGHDQIVQLLLKAGAEVNAHKKNGTTALQGASWAGHDQIVQLLLNAGAEVNVQNKLRETALALASIDGHDQVVQLLLKAGAEVRAKSEDGETALMVASAYGHDQVVQLLLMAGAEVNTHSEDGHTALMFARERGHDQVIQLLLKAGAEVNAQSKDGETALMTASRKGQDQVVQLLLMTGAEVNAQNIHGWTALLKASACGHDQVIQLLLKAGAEVNAQSEDGQTTLMNASEYGRDQIVQLLLKAGAEVNAQSKDGETALMTASRRGHDQVVQLLLKAGAAVSAHNKNGHTALMTASIKRRDKVVQLLLMAHAEVNAQSKDGETALTIASIYGQDQVIQVLLKAGAAVNAQSKDGDTALLKASECGHNQVVQLLLKAGAEVNAQDINGWTALMNASACGHNQVVLLLLKAGAEVNVQDIHGWTALRRASECGRDQVVRLLLKAGAEVNARSNDGQTALVAAQERGHDHVAQLLLEAGTSQDE